MSIKIITPTTEAEWQKYFALRYDVLREPWGQPIGSELLTDDPEAIHAMAVDKYETALGVARLHFNSPIEGQIRCMAVSTHAQGQGIGRIIVEYLEQAAQTKGATSIILEARENAVPFYEALGYTITQKSYLLFGEIQHYKMQKELIISN